MIYNINREEQCQITLGFMHLVLPHTSYFIPHTHV
jgi:hypothetical protein